MLARLVWGEDTDDPEQIAAAVWLYNDLTDRITNAVAAGIGQAFAKK